MKNLIVWLGMLLAFGTAQAEWQLVGEHSSISFVSIKNADIAESHSFGEMAGSLAADGQFRVAITLDSVDTLVLVRDERMREVLFDTANHPLAVVSGQIGMDAVGTLDLGHTTAIDAGFELALHGKTTAYTTRVEVTRVSPGQLLVVTLKPVLINATTLGLGEGVEKLQEIAGLAAISKAVPVYFSLQFSGVH